MFTLFLFFGLCSFDLRFYILCSFTPVSAVTTQTLHILIILFKYCVCMCGTGGLQDLSGYCRYPDRVKLSGMFAGYLQLHRHPPHTYRH